MAKKEDKLNGSKGSGAERGGDSAELPEKNTAPEEGAVGEPPPPEEIPDSNAGEDSPEGAEDAEAMSRKSGNTFLRRLMDRNFIEYASYVIKERAIPDVDDGLKPVQRRILWSLYRMDDGKFHKVANVIGDTMKYHPHGDASIGDALVVLANKEYYIDRQGNFGNILTGDVASAARYIECRLTPLAKETLFNNDITEFTDSYDGRNKEPLVLPGKLPSLLMLGAEGIAVGMATKIFPHNFRELVEAQIAILKGEDFEVYPDFPQGGVMDVSEYNQGNGKIKLRAKIERDGRKLIIREVPASTTTESLIASIEKAVNANKMKIAAVNDYTTDKVEIEITPMRGYAPEKALKALYAYTDCSVSLSASLMVIKDKKPANMSVPEVLRRNTGKLLDYLKRELEIELGKLEDRFHEKTLAQIFIENRIYKRIEDCESNESVFDEVRKGLNKFKKLLKRPITDDDIEKLLAIPIRRISLFDINKNKKDLDDILKDIDRVTKSLKRLKSYTIKYLEGILKKYAEGRERRTEIVDAFDRVDKQAVALNNIRVGWDRKNCYIGTAVKSDDKVMCNEYDHLLCVERNGKYKVVNIPDKAFVGRLYYFTKHDKAQEYFVVYSDKKTGKFFAKRTCISKFITDREYRLCPKGCRLEILTTRANSLYEFALDVKRGGGKSLEMNLSDAPERSPQARGIMISPKKVLGFKFMDILDPDVLEIKDDDGEAPDDALDASNLPLETAETAGTPSDESSSNTTSNADSKKKKDDSKNAPTETSDVKADVKGKVKTGKRGASASSSASKRQAKSNVSDEKKEAPATPKKKRGRPKGSGKKQTAPPTTKPAKPAEPRKKKKSAASAEEEDALTDSLDVSQPEFGF